MTHAALDLWAGDAVALLQHTERTSCGRGLALWTTYDLSVFVVMVGFTLNLTQCQTSQEQSH